jgi:hypothetical protein
MDSRTQSSLSSSDSRALLYTACKQGNVILAERLLSKGADYSQYDSNGETLLTMACRHRQIDIVKLLLKYGANVDQINAYGSTALYHVCAYDYPDIVKSLLEHGANINKKCNCLFHENTPLTNACTRRKFNIVEILLMNGAHVDATLYKRKLDVKILYLLKKAQYIDSLVKITVPFFQALWPSPCCTSRASSWNTSDSDNCVSGGFILLPLPPEIMIHIVSFLIDGTVTATSPTIATHLETIQQVASTIDLSDLRYRKCLFTIDFKN